MHIHGPKTSFVMFVLWCVVFVLPAAAAFDRKKLHEAGEDYVIALHDTYLEASKRLKADRHPEVPRFFQDRAIEIEKGAETFPAHPSEFPISDEVQQLRLSWAYEETFGVVTSEAADEEPYLVANVQIAYEHWLITTQLDPADPDREKLARSFDRTLDALTNSPAVASTAAPAVLASLATPVAR